MKRMISIFLTVALLASLLSTTAFGENINEIQLSFTAPSVGDVISNDTLAAAVSSSVPNECYIKKIYTGIDVSELEGLTFDTYQSFVTSKSENIANGTYTSQEYIAIIAIDSDNLTDATKVTFTGATGGKLFLDNSLYVYVTFTPTGNTSAGDTPLGDTSTGSTSTGSTSYTPSNNTHDVYVTYQEGESSATIYSVDIVWESMEFTYTSASEGTWDPNTHTFTDKESASWSFANNKITVTNHSNADVNTSFSYTPAANFSAVSSAFVDVHKNAIDNATLTLSSAVGSTLDEAPSSTAYLSLTGELSSSLATKTVCGTVTVTIN